MRNIFRKFDADSCVEVTQIVERADRLAGKRSKYRASANSAERSNLSRAVTTFHRHHGQDLVGPA